MSELEQLAKIQNRLYDKEITIAESIELIQAECNKALATQRQALRDEVEKAIDGVEIDIGAIFKHFEGLGLPEDEEARQKLIANIAYDDRHDTLNDVRTAISTIFEDKK